MHNKGEKDNLEKGKRTVFAYDIIIHLETTETKKILSSTLTEQPQLFYAPALIRQKTQ
jgi:hypothetical protein